MRKSTKASARDGGAPFSFKNDLTRLLSACDAVEHQTRDDAFLEDVESVFNILRNTVSEFGNIWLCGHGSGFCLAVEIAQKLALAADRYESPTRSAVLGLNGALSTTAYGQQSCDDAFGAELSVQARRGDALWCFAPDPSVSSVLMAAERAHNELKIPVVAFTTYPGTPLIRFSAAKVRLQLGDSNDAGGACIDRTHMLLAHLLCTQLKRAARTARNS